MVNLDEARLLVEAEILQDPPYEANLRLEVIDSRTIEKEWGWVFFYDSAEHIRTGDDKHLIAGNAPIIVNRNSGQLIVTGTAWPVEKYIDDYETQLQSGV